MPPLKLDAGWSLRSIERSLQSIVDNAGAPLQLKKDFVNKRKGAMHDAARLQMLATWARLAPEKRLYFHGENQKDAVVEDLCDYAPGISVLRLCDNISIGKEEVPRINALAPAKRKMECTDSFEWDKVIKGRTIDLVCVSGAKIQYLRPLFSARKSNAVKSKEEMFWVFSHIIDFVNKNDGRLIPKSFIKACAIFANELIKNTQEHATRNHQNQQYFEHVEGLILSWDEMPEASYKQDFEGSQRLLDFWTREAGKKKSLRCLQLSFFDTGPGFASRATGKEINELSTEGEKKALLDCLKKNVSTKRETGAGNGLPAVLESLREVGGLMSIRSGRLNVFNVFAPNEKRDLFDFEDWFDREVPRKLAPVAGAIISLLVPIRRESDA